MSTSESKLKISNLPDTQGLADTRNMPINKVGIKDILHPMVIKQRSGKDQSTIANFNMYVNLPHDVKGTHMSRFVHILNNHEEHITVDTFKKMIDEMLILLEADSGHVEMRFPYFINKTAPISKVQSLLDYTVSFIGEIEDGTSKLKVKVLVPVTSLCPWSKKISEYGAHNQRSHVTITVAIKDFIWIEEIIDIVERESSSELYGLLKRPDEKSVTERAYENPKFVEDMVRDIAVHFKEDDRVTEYTVESENFESIHNHSAYAQIHKVKDWKIYLSLTYNPLRISSDANVCIWTKELSSIITRVDSPLSPPVVTFMFITCDELSLNIFAKNPLDSSALSSIEIFIKPLDWLLSRILTPRISRELTIDGYTLSYISGT